MLIIVLPYFNKYIEAMLPSPLGRDFFLMGGPSKGVVCEKQLERSIKKRKKLQ